MDRYVEANGAKEDGGVTYPLLKSDRMERAPLV